MKPLLGKFYIEDTKLKFSWLIGRKFIIEINDPQPLLKFDRNKLFNLFYNYKFLFQKTQG